MDCDAIRDDMLDVLYGEGGEAAVRRVEAHQAGCAECRRELASLRRLRGDLAQWRLPERLGVSPDECVFVDDRMTNVRAAEAVGMRAIHRVPGIEKLRADLSALSVL